ncbi:MAG: glycosyltransferase, partial [Acidobacteriota bacterium]
MSRAAPVKVLFASGSPALNESTLKLFLSIGPDLPLVVCSEFPTSEGEWIPYHIRRSLDDNLSLLQSKLAGRTIELGAIVLEPDIPHERLRAMGRALSATRCIAFDETGRSFTFDLSGLPGRLQFNVRRFQQALTAALAPKSRLRRTIAGLADWQQIKLPWLYRRALARGRSLAANRPSATAIQLQSTSRPDGVSVLIPSRNGRELLDLCLRSLLKEQTAFPTEIIIVDNGSDDGTDAWLATEHPNVVLESNAEPLAFAVAVNRGIRRTRYSHVCVLNNDMQVEPGFLAALRGPFDQVPELFCSSAQIFLPEGERREETGKTVLNTDPPVLEFPVRCDVPLDGEDLSYVLYGSGGCTLYDADKLTALGGFDEIYTPAYVEDLDLGVRGWLRGWPSVYCAGSKVLHQHRATTSRYYTEQQLEVTLEVNFTRFLARTIADRELFLNLWNRNVLRLKAQNKTEALQAAASLPTFAVPSGDLRFLDLVNGETCVFPGKPRSEKPVVLIASPYLPFPLSHGAAVRIFNLMRESADDFDLVLLAFVEQSAPVPRELLDLCVEVVTVQRKGSHAPPSQGRPDTVEEFDRPAFRAALRQTIAKWRPGIVQLEFTQMAAYAADCAPAKTILVEHDITYDLYAQLLANPATNDWEAQRQHHLWVDFEIAAWKQVDRVVTMSAKD